MIIGAIPWKRGGIVEENGRRWKKMDEKKKFEKSKKKSLKKKCLESAGDGLGTLIGYKGPQKIL